MTGPVAADFRSAHSGMRAQFPGTRIVCLGDLMVDVVARLDQQLQVGSDTHAEVRWAGGGSAANTACWLAADGVHTVFVGRVGADVPGEASLQALRACGVDARVSVDPALATGTCVVLVDSSGERTMVPSAGANTTLAEADVHAAQLGAGDRLHLSGYALFGPQRAAALAALHAARELRLAISLGAASSAPLRELGADAFISWAQGTTVFANRDEAEVLVGGHDAQAAAAVLASALHGAAVVTDGSRAAYWSDGTSSVGVPAGSVEVVDPTGAGDAFAAGFLAATVRGATPADALAHGHDLAAAACRSVGARPATANR